MNATFVLFVSKNQRSRVRNALTPELVGDARWRERKTLFGSEFYFSGPSAIARQALPLPPGWPPPELEMRGIAATSIAAGLVALLSASEALAWGETGHRATGDLAWEQLTPKARAAVNAIVAGGNPGNAPNCRARTLADMAEWPDCVRGNPAYASWTPLHFADIPLCGAPDPAVYCRQGACATAALTRAETTLRAAASRPTERFLALAQLAHFLGDIHQPLHVADNDDRGGNAIHASGLGEQNLHHTWDTTLVNAALGSERQAVQRLRPLVEEHRRDWTAGSFETWAAESHQIAVTAVYKPLPQPPACHASAGVEALDQAYFNQAAPVVRTQIAKASVRLAAKLNAIFN
jgi:hypothetical protein